MAMSIDAMSDDEMATWFENAEPEDFDTVIEGEALVALTRARALEKQAQESMRAAVILARKEGLSWQTIGEKLDISRQAAHKRFASL